MSSLRLIENFYWVGVRDISEASEDLDVRDWTGEGRDGAEIEEEDLFLFPLRNYTFKIRNFGSTIDDTAKFAYTDRLVML